MKILIMVIVKKMKDSQDHNNKRNRSKINSNRKNR